MGRIIYGEKMSAIVMTDGKREIIRQLLIFKSSEILARRDNKRNDGS